MRKRKRGPGESYVNYSPAKKAVRRMQKEVREEKRVAEGMCRNCGKRAIAPSPWGRPVNTCMPCRKFEKNRKFRHKQRERLAQVTGITLEPGKRCSLCEEVGHDHRVCPKAKEKRSARRRIHDPDKDRQPEQQLAGSHARGDVRALTKQEGAARAHHDGARASRPTAA